MTNVREKNSLLSPIQHFKAHISNFQSMVRLSCLLNNKSPKPLTADDMSVPTSASIRPVDTCPDTITCPVAAGADEAEIQNMVAGFVSNGYEAKVETDELGVKIIRALRKEELPAEQPKLVRSKGRSKSEKPRPAPKKRKPLSELTPEELEKRKKLAEARALNRKIKRESIKKEATAPPVEIH